MSEWSGIKISVPETMVGQDPAGVTPRAGIEFGLRDVLLMLWRNRRLMFGVAALLTGLATLVTFQLTPLYRGDLLIMIAPPKAKVVAIESVLPGLPFDLDTINSEIAIIQSRYLAEQVVRKLKLDRDPEFNPALRGGWGPLSWITSIFAGKSGDNASDGEKLARDRARVTDAFRRAIDVRPKYRSRVIVISVSSRDAKKSVRLTNAVGILYMEEQLRAKLDATKRAVKWLSERTVELRVAVDRAEHAVEAYRRKHGLFKGKGDITAATAQMSEISSQLVVARGKRAESEARLEQIERLLKSKNGVESAAEILSSVIIQGLRARESEVTGKIAGLSVEYGPKHPSMIAARAEMLDLRRKIADEVRRVIEKVRGDVNVAKAGEQSLMRSLKKLEQKVARLNEKSVKLRSLEREATANRALLETVLARFKEANAQKGIQSPDARIVSPAVIPTRPYFPNQPLFIGVAFIGSLVFGISLVSLLEHLDSGFRSAQQVEAIIGRPTLGLIPEIASVAFAQSQSEGSKGEKTPNVDTKTARGLGISRLQISEFLENEPLSQYAESVRGVLISLQLIDVDNPPKIIMVASAAPGEGKSTLAFSLARIAAKSAKKVILLDCDLRRPIFHEFLGIDGTPGLVELLAGKITQAEVVHKDKSSGLHLIPAGSGAPNPADLLASKQFKVLLNSLSRDYDLVIVDSPPVMAVNDARVMSGLVDAVLFVVYWGKTRRGAAAYAAGKLAEVGGRIIGIVLTRVELARLGDYGYADSGYYSPKYSRYYGT